MDIDISSVDNRVLEQEDEYFPKKPCAIRDYSKVIYLEVSFEDISKRVSGFNNRGFIKDSDQTVEEVFLRISNIHTTLYRITTHQLQNV